MKKIAKKPAPYELHYDQCLTFHKASLRKHDPKLDYLNTLSDFEHRRRKATLLTLADRMGTTQENPIVYYLLYVSKACSRSADRLHKLFPPLNLQAAPKDWWQVIQGDARLSHEIDRATLAYYASQKLSSACEVDTGNYWKGVLDGLTAAGYRVKPVWWAWFVWDYENYPELSDSNEDVLRVKFKRDTSNLMYRRKGVDTK